MMLRIISVIAMGLLFAGCRHTPPAEVGKYRQPDLVELKKLDPSIRLDIRYATTNNFTHRPVYGEARAFLQRPAAEALVRAHEVLKQKGYGLLIFDGYRPWAVTKFFWDTASKHEREIEFVANPENGSKHNRGCAVDLTLCELGTGREITMPSEYDEFSERAFPAYQGGPAGARTMREVLREAMEAEGFRVYRSEWWHFDYKDWREYPILDLPFESIPR